MAEASSVARSMKLSNVNPDKYSPAKSGRQEIRASANIQRYQMW